MTAPGGGFAHMDTGAVLPIMQGLAEAGRTLGGAWQGSRATIAEKEGGIGSDVLGQAFRSVYTAPSTAMRDAADRIPGAIVTDSAVGTQCAADYQAADARGAAAFPSRSAGGGGGGRARADF
jgi:hypothetical protein